MRRKLNEKVRRPKNPVNIMVKRVFWETALQKNSLFLCILHDFGVKSLSMSGLNSDILLNA